MAKGISTQELDTLLQNRLDSLETSPPLTHASTHATGGSDPVSPASIGAASASDVGNMSSVPTTAKNAAGAITELHEAIDNIDAGVTSVNGKAGAVVLTAADVGANPTSDYIRQPGYVVATGSANTYVAMLSPTLTAYVDGVAIAVKIPANSSGNSTLNVNGLGAKAIVKANGTSITGDTLKAGLIYSMRYSSSANLGIGAFILQGEGGSGDATSANLLAGKRASVDAGDIVGTMPNRETGNYGATGPTRNGTTLEFGIPANAYYGTEAKLSRTDANFIAANIKKDVSIFGNMGTYESGIPTVTRKILNPSTVSILTNAPTSIEFQVNIDRTANGIENIPLEQFISMTARLINYTDDSLSVSTSFLDNNLISLQVEYHEFLIPISTQTYSWTQKAGGSFSTVRVGHIEDSGGIFSFRYRIGVNAGNTIIVNNPASPFIPFRVDLTYWV